MEVFLTKDFIMLPSKSIAFGVREIQLADIPSPAIMGKW
jgi:hypothetical protein